MILYHHDLINICMISYQDSPYLNVIILLTDGHTTVSEFTYNIKVYTTIFET